MPRDDDREGFFLRTIQHEGAPMSHQHHPSLEMLFDALDEAAPLEARSRVSAHLANCEPCRARWKRLKGRLVDEYQVLKDGSHVLDFDALVSQRAASRVGWREWLRSLFVTRTIVVAAAAAAALVLAAAIAIPWIRPSALRTSEQIEVLTNEIEMLRNQVDAFTSVGSVIPNNGFLILGIQAKDLLAYDWENLQIYDVQPGDTWESIADEQLGDVMLWPLIWLLNRDLGPPDVAPPPSAALDLPASMED